MTPQEFCAARAALGLSVAKMAAVLSVQPRSIQRWQAGDQIVPGPVAVALRLMLIERSGRGG